MFPSSTTVRERRAKLGRVETIPDVGSPQLGNRRDLSVFLPPSYRDGADFPVLYMQDGQNLFDPRTSFAGEWGVDEAIEAAAEEGRTAGAIVVGIPNMGFERIREYSPFEDPKHGGGNGDLYVDWLVSVVKPLIDRTYRTRPEAEFTGIVGSSLGALISLYAFFREPVTFGIVGVMSPALWFAEGAIFDFVRDAHTVPGRIYIDVGGREGIQTMLNARRMRDLLIEKGYRSGRTLSWVEDADAHHNEAAWGRRFADALPFLVEGRHP